MNVRAPISAWPAQVAGYDGHMADKTFSKGDKVEWNSHGGKAVGKVERKHPVQVRDLEFLKANTDRRTKMTVPGPFTMSQQAQNDHYESEAQLALDYPAAVNAEIRDLFAAGAGMLYLFRTLGVRGPGAVVGGLAFMLSPYSLDYAARISVTLLPWAALPWMLALVVRALRDQEDGECEGEGLDPTWSTHVRLLPKVRACVSDGGRVPHYGRIETVRQGETANLSDRKWGNRP